MRQCVTAAAASLIIAACGGGGSQRTQSTIRQGPWMIRLSDETAIRKVMLQPADVPPGWSGNGSVSRHQSQVTPSTGTEPCLGTPWPDTHETAYLTSAEYADR